MFNSLLPEVLLSRTDCVAFVEMPTYGHICQSVVRAPFEPIPPVHIEPVPKTHVSCHYNRKVKYLIVVAISRLFQPLFGLPEARKFHGTLPI